MDLLFTSRKMTWSLKALSNHLSEILSPFLQLSMITNANRKYQSSCDGIDRFLCKNVGYFLSDILTLATKIVRLVQWKNKMVIVDGIVFFFFNRNSRALDRDRIFFRWKAQLCLDWQNSSVHYHGCSGPNFSEM